MTVKVGKSLADRRATVSCVRHATDNAISIALRAGKQLAIFKVDESRCGLKDDRVRCAPRSQ